MDAAKTWVLAARFFTQKFSRRAGTLNRRQRPEWDALVELYHGAVVLLAFEYWTIAEEKRLRSNLELGAWNFLGDWHHDTYLETASKVQHTDDCPAIGDAAPCDCVAGHGGFTKEQPSQPSENDFGLLLLAELYKKDSTPSDGGVK